MSIAPQRNVLAPMSNSHQQGRFALWNLRSSMGLAEFARKRRAANLSSIIPVGLMEVGAGPRRSVDIPPEIDIPVDF